MPKDKILEIINNTDSQIILIGGDDVKELGLSIEAAFDSNRINNMVGKASITDSAYILSKSNLVIAPDTGMLHIATALKKPTISIWGSTVPDFGVYPYYGSEEITHLKIENTTLSCRPCSKHGSKKCPKIHFKCMNDLDTSDLVEKINLFVD
jgi:heptosyltransferase-2